ncbi:MAG TPA: carbohydrate binding family 9 domain-containing protein, partial [Gammaproteobacteria bacterium]|nr:carbohydrate binding family 9 domain-containing protein [Gammaproteobacteria bacterium]
MVATPWKSRLTALWLVATLSLWPLAARAALQFRAVRVSHPLALTGRLDDPAWQLAPPATEAFQAYPHASALSPYPMQVRVLYDDRYLYIGIQADDPHPELIREHYERRDRLFSPNSDDVLMLYLDALDTGRSAQMFAVDLHDSQLDGDWREDSQSEDYSPDFNWRAVSAHNARGWSTVIRIPYTSLRYRPGPHQTWKLIVARNVIRENFYWIVSTKLPAGYNCLLCYAGDLVLDDFPDNVQHHSLSLIPEVTFTHDADHGDFGTDSRNHTNLGGYLSWQPTAGT